MMIRAALFALACIAATPALAQDAAQTERASTALAAIWRPAPETLTQASMRSACAGALEEMAAVESAMPAVLTPTSLERVRSIRGLLIVPSGDDPAWAFFFPPSNLTWFTSGIGAIAVLDEGQGLIGVRDAAGRDIPFQLGHAGQVPILRIRQPEGGLLSFVGCAPVSPRS